MTLKPSTAREVLGTRRVTLLASVAALGAAVLIAGPGGYAPSGFTASARATEAVAQHPASFADVVAKVKPAVISVRVKMDAVTDAGMTEQNGGEEMNPQDPNSPMYKFFRYFSPEQMPGMRHRPEMSGEGSGFFITADGYAVTNYHVVDRAKSVQVMTDDGTSYAAKVIGTDQKTDLALIKVEGKGDFPFVKFAEHAPRVGDWVVAVGNPFGLGGTVTAGIVSARGRDIGAGPYDDYVQIDAPINKGNSGGPAFDVDGNVIGVNTSIFSPSGGSVGIGFDIPAETAKLVVAQLKDSGHVTRGWLGVQIQPVTAGIADSLGLKKAEGAMVSEPQKGSPAAEAGIQSGDIIRAVNGTTVKDARELARTVGMLAPKTEIKLDIIRQGQEKTVTVTLGEMAKDRRAQADKEPAAAPTSDVPHLGLSLAPAGDVAGAGDTGVVVMNVEPEGPAAEQGIERGNVILDVGGKPVANVGDVRSALKQAKTDGKHTVLMRVRVGEATRFIAMPLGNA